MVQITAVSGELVLEVEDIYSRMADDGHLGRTVRDLKKFLAVQTGHPRFKQRLLGDGGHLQDDMPLPELANMQLVILNFANQDKTSAERLCRACAKNLVDQVEILLQKPQDPNVRGLMGRKAPIHIAAEFGHLEVVQLLIEAGADMNVAAGRMTALKAAVAKGFFAVTRCLVQNGADLRHSLHIAALHGNLRIARLLLDAGAETDERNNTLDSGMTALHLAAGSGCLEMVQLLIENGANIDVAMTGGQTPWQFMPPESVMNVSGRNPGLGRRGDEMPRHLDLVKMRDLVRSLNDFLKAKLEVERLFGKEPACMLPVFLANGFTALHLAVFSGQLEVIEFLVQHGADLRQSLHVAIFCCNSKIARLLLAAGAEKDEKNNTLDSGMTALHLAAGSGCLEMVQLLIENGANIDVAMTGGQTPWQFMPPESVMNVSGRNPGLGRRGDEMPRHLDLVKMRDLVRSLNDFLKAKLEVERLFGKEPACMLPVFLANGFTALHLAVFSGQLEVIEFLVQHGADLRQSLHVAIFCCNSKIARLLLAAGAEKDEMNNTLDSGMTALHLAAGSGCLKMVQLLVENGANIDVAMTGGQTPWQFMPLGSMVNGSTAVRLAFLRGHQDVVRFLVGARFELSAAQQRVHEIHMA